MKRLKMTSCRTAAMSFAAVLAAGLASAAVYVKPLAEGEERETTGVFVIRGCNPSLLT